MVRPALFLGSSTEGLPIARSIQLVLERDCESELWTQGTFRPMGTTLESLIGSLCRFDFAIFALTADDLSTSRGRRRAVARDNLIFELGLFLGSLGRDRTFMVYDRTCAPNLPSDLDGVTPVTFEPHSNGNLEAALGAPCERIRRALEQHGIRKDKGLMDLEKVALDVEDVGAKMDELLPLLAESRKIEIGMMIAKFGFMIGPENVAKLRENMADFERILGQRAGVKPDSAT